MYVLLDSNLTAGYYLPRSLHSKKATQRIENLFDSVCSGASEHFFYLPNFCVAEVFSVFMKHSSAHGTDTSSAPSTLGSTSLVEQFQADIHNGSFIYHYELSRYHVLGINLVAPVDHYYQVSRGRRNIAPMGTFDHLIISMGIHLAHIHGRENTAIVSADSRLTDVLRRCKSNIPAGTVRKLKLDQAQEITGRAFAPEVFPRHLNMKTATNRELAELFGSWPLPVATLPKVYRWKE